MNVINEVISDKVTRLIGGKVEYYWEHESDSFPTIEVFLNGTKGELLYKSEEVNELITLAGISEDKAEIDAESFADDYHRIIIVMDFNVLQEDELLTLVDILKDYGSCIKEAM